MKVPLPLKVPPLASAQALLSQPAHPSHTPAGQFWTAGGQYPRNPLSAIQLAGAPAASALAQPAANSTALLAAKIEQAQEQTFDADAVLQDPAVQQRVNAAAAVAANVPMNAVLYHGLEPVNQPLVPSEGARLVPKQLHPAWVAKRHMKPELQDLWQAGEQHVAVLSTGISQHHINLSRTRIATHVLTLQ